MLPKNKTKLLLLLLLRERRLKSSPAEQTLRIPSGKDRQTLCTLWLCCLGFHTYNKGFQKISISTFYLSQTLDGFNVVFMSLTFTSQTSEPRCEEPTSYTSTRAAPAGRPHLFALSPAKIKGNVGLLLELVQKKRDDPRSTNTQVL